MRLSKIKLAGFKTFVDPTTIPFPGNLVCIVGPNGCGKSNVIDAVRWVMGESSAKHLRGDSMSDVIFNGSSTRKPVGQASIELVFDNSDGRLGGEYAKYNEIAIKRVVTRDGTSSYFLNGVRCRRRDITGIFLGTGLGPRSYAVIEQGTISRFVEARPEEMRNFLEEAAGISRYKERRRETENRIRHTRENLDRLNDLRDELDKQLARLKRQSQTAARYKTLKQEERLLKGQLHALRWQRLDRQCGERERRNREQETALQALLSKLRSNEAEVEKQRQLHAESQERFGQVQSRFYSVGSDIARVEEAIQHRRERRQQQERDLARLEQAWKEANDHMEADRKKLERLQNELQRLEPELERARETRQTSAATLEEAERVMQEWQQQWEEFNQRYAEPSQNAQLERARLHTLEQQSAQLEKRMERLAREREELDPEAEQQRMTELQKELEPAESRAAGLQEEQAARQQRITAQREQNHALATRLDELRNRLQTLRGRHASLEALQQAALNRDQGETGKWLARQRLQDAGRLVEELNVENGWERAVETVLEHALEAICVEDLESYCPSLRELEGTVTLFDTASSALPPPREETLSSKVHCPWSLEPLLGHVLTAADLPTALAMRERLAAHESVITPEGVWLGINWLRVARGQDEKSGVLEREQELKELAQEMARLESRIRETESELADGRERLKELEQQREAEQRELHELTRQVATLQAGLSGARVRQEQSRQRVERIGAELEELAQQLKANAREQANTRLRLNEALARMEQLATQRESLTAQRERLRQDLHTLREQARRDRDAAHAVELKREALRTELASTRQALERLEQQREQFSERREELQQALTEADAPLEEMGARLEQLLTQRSAIEKEMTEVRREVEAVEHRIRELNDEHNRIGQELEGARRELEQSRMEWQDLKTRRQTQQEQLEEAGHTLTALFEEMPEEASEESWQQRLAALEQKISRLGPINLAAIDEYREAEERKQYLDAQHADLTEALTTLETAIRKIDRETRSRFRETFDRVNNGFQEMFPRLFGGGKASLELTGEDLLEAGVTVMAHPPGKRNSTIHLLSGGEKALTAVALVFAIFQLNPAPFCMLDEVDAPLDDANVGRFCDLVREMSSKTQFIFITHNKITMELSQQLNGITMKEPGVSRLVAVDLDEAAAMAASA